MFNQPPTEALEGAEGYFNPATASDRAPAQCRGLGKQSLPWWLWVSLLLAAPIANYLALVALRDADVAALAPPRSFVCRWPPWSVSSFFTRSPTPTVLPVRC
jgi:hypothetical protein